MKQLKIEIFGRVQGVGFRHFVKGVAERLGINGEVMNREDGSVLIFGQGGKKELASFLKKVERGPRLARVEGISYYWNDSYEERDDFRIVVEKSFLKDQGSSFINLGKKILGIEKKVPRHVAIIPDGNRRWAMKNGMKGVEGHRKSATHENFKALLVKAKDLKIDYLTFWVFSTENWNRDGKEIKELFKIMKGLFEKVGKDLMENKIRFRHLGRKDRLPKDLIKVIEDLENKTKTHSEFNLQLCIDYGGRDEIVRAMNKALQSKAQEVNEEDLDYYLDSTGIPDPDLVIRTSGEKRMSGFMPFQSVYSEFYFTDVHFPEFTPDELGKAVDDFGKRKRRYGGG